jgi:chloramphenicol-sensitive protein RarD
VERDLDRRGLAAAFAAYGLWGVFPLYFHLLDQSGALEIVAHRIWWTLVFCAIGVTALGAWGKVRAAMADRRLFLGLLGAGVLVSLNWLIYIYAVVSGHIVDGALGYFINPLVTVVIAMIFLRERITIGQGVALGIGLAAVLVIAIGTGTVPWIGFGLALTFGFYSLAKKRIGARVTPFIGLGVEALALAPLSGLYIIFLEVSGNGTWTSISGWYAGLLAAAGIVTAIPLLLFAVGAARLPLVTLAFIQYITPMSQFLIGVVVFHEQMPTVRWIGFGLVWLALVVLSWDTVRRTRARGGQATVEDEPPSPPR